MTDFPNNFNRNILKAESHCSDNENDDDHDKENAFFWLNCFGTRRIRTRSFNQWNAFSLSHYRSRSRYRCSGTGPIKVYVKAERLYQQ